MKNGQNWKVKKVDQNGTKWESGKIDVLPVPINSKNYG